MYLKILKQKGFTIIEVLISLAIFAIVAMPISMMVLHSVKINKQSEVKQQSMMIAQDLMENIKALPDKDLINETSLEILKEENLKIIKVGNEGSFDISGSSKGYIIEGYIKPINKYKFNTNNSDIKKTINIYINEKPSLVLKVKDKDENLINTIQLRNKNISIVKKSENTLIVDDQNIEFLDNIDDIGVFLANGCTGKYAVDIENNSEKESNIYFYKKESSSATYNIRNQGGIFSIYSNILIPEEQYSNNNRLYEIYVKAKKGKDVFEAYSYKNIK